MSAEDIEYMDDYKYFPTKESALDWLDNYLSLDERNNLIRALEQEPCEEAVSRQAVLSKIKKVCFSEEWGQFRVDNGSNGQRDFLINYIEQLPPVTPQPKMGRWIEVDIGNCRATLKCSVCDRVIEPTFTFGEYSYEDINRYYPYCHCGAKMEVE